MKLATGSGKSIIIAYSAWAIRISNFAKYAIIVVPNFYLLQQGKPYNDDTVTAYGYQKFTDKKYVAMMTI